MTRRRFFFWFYVFFCFTPFLHTQIINDPNDPMYKQIDRWAVQGYITRSLPQIRPYPLQVIHELLQEVQIYGNTAAQEKVAWYKKVLQEPVHVGAILRGVGKNNEQGFYGAPTMDGIITMEPWLTGSIALQVYGSDRLPNNEIKIPETDSPFNDFVVDAASLGKFTVMQNWHSTLAIGYDQLYLQMGLNRSSVGPFYDNGIVVGPQAGRAGHYSLFYQKGIWSVGVLWLVLAATDDFGKGQFPNKHVLLRTIDVKILPNLELGILESVVWGGRFEMLYLNPFNQYFAAQSMTGFEDNSLFALQARWLVVPGLQILGQIYADDLDFNDMVRLNFNTKYKLAAELGLRYVHNKSIFQDVEMNYTAVMPYMYTHINDDYSKRYTPQYPNYFNYTHRGKNLGVDLEPNSDRLFSKLTFMSFSNAEISLSGYFTRHGNASEGIHDMTSLNDGTIFDDGYTTVDTTHPIVTFNGPTRFLTQSVIDYRLAGALSLSWSLPTSFGVFGTQADYVLEYGWNRNLVKDNNGITNFWGLSASWRW